MISWKITVTTKTTRASFTMPTSAKATAELVCTKRALTMATGSGSARTAEKDRGEGEARGHDKQHIGERGQLPPGEREEQGSQHDLYALEDLAAVRACQQQQCEQEDEVRLLKLL